MNMAKIIVSRGKALSCIINSRKIMIEALRKKIATETGLIALGRSEIFEIFFDGDTPAPTRDVIDAVAARLLLAEYPVISVNGNAVALSAKDLIKLAKEINAKIEVNLLYRTNERLEAIRRFLNDEGASDDIILIPEYGTADTLDGISSARKFIHKEGISKADVVLVLMEDGDRVKALVDRGKVVIAIEINPLSPTASMANVALIDNIVRAIPAIKNAVSELKKKKKDELKIIAATYDHESYLSKVIELLRTKVNEYISSRKPITSLDADTLLSSQ